MPFIVQSKIVVTTTTWWPMPARLAMEFATLGARVGAVCPADSPLGKVSTVSEVFRYSPLAPTRSLAAALRAMQPDLVIPCDDRALAHLHELHAAADAGDELRRLIERSLGDPARYSATRSRGETLALARQEGILEPATQVLRSEADLLALCEQRKLPVVLKADGSWGGDGVAVVDSTVSARTAFSRMTRPVATSHVVKCLLSYRDAFPLHGWLHRRRSAVVGQNRVLGREANIMIACWQGEVLATASVEVLDTTQEFGAATIIQPITHPEMETAATRLVRRLGMSGFCGLDFIIEEGTGRPYMIELNPRATQLGHLLLAPTGTLAEALLARLRGEVPPKASRPRINQETVAFFPQAWMPGATSPRLNSAYQDIPWEEPALLAYLLRRLGDGRGLLKRLTDRLMRRRDPARLMAEFRAKARPPGPHNELTHEARTVTVSARQAGDRDTCAIKQHSSLSSNVP